MNLTNNNPHIEISIPMDSLFLTITLNPKFYLKRARMQYLITSDLVKTILKKYCSEFVMIPELTPKRGNIHYHGYIVFDTKIYPNHDIEYLKMHLLDTLKIIGLSKINTQAIKETKRTAEYMTKSLKETDSIINKTVSNDNLKLLLKYKKKEKIEAIQRDEIKKDDETPSNNLNNKKMFVSFND